MNVPSVRLPLSKAQSDGPKKNESGKSEHIGKPRSRLDIRIIEVARLEKGSEVP